MATSPNTTRKINKALRASNLPEALVIERYPNGKARRHQHGWYISKENGITTICHSGINFQLEREAGQQFAQRVTEILESEGLTTEVVIEITRHTLTNAERPYVRQIKVTETAN